MKTIVIMLLTAATAHGITIEMQGPAHYHGPDSPTPQVWDARLRATFAEVDGVIEVASTEFESNTPSGDVDATVSWTFIDETTQKYFQSDDGLHEVTLVTDGDWNDGDLTVQNFAERVVRIEYSWFDPAYNPLGNLQTRVAVHPPTYRVVAVPEPSAIILLCLGMVGCFVRSIRAANGLAAVVLMVALTGSVEAQPPGPEPPTGDNAETPIGFTWRAWEGQSGRVPGALTLTYRADTGKAIVWAPGSDTFHSVYLRNLQDDWLIDSPDDCFYDGPDYVCDSGVMTRVLGFEDRHPPSGGLFTHWEMPSEWGVGRDVDDLLPALWIGGATYGFERGPGGLTMAHNGFNVGISNDGVAGPFLVTLDAPSVPEPSALALLFLGTALLLRKGRCR